MKHQDEKSEIKETGANSWCEALYDSQSAKLVLYGQALGLSRAEAEDVLQEVFIALLALPSAPMKPEHYAIRAYRNRTHNRHRSWLRRALAEVQARRWFECSSDESPAELAAMRCLQKLPPDQREVIVLKIWHEHTFEEIADLLDESPNTIAGRYRYGLQKIRNCLVPLKESLYEKDANPSEDSPTLVDGGRGDAFVLGPT